MITISRGLTVGGRALVLTMSVTAVLSAQEGRSIAQRIAQAAPGVVRFSAPSRPELCGWGEGNVFLQPRRISGWQPEGSRYWESEVSCQTGPVRVVLERADGVVTRVRVFVGGRWRAGIEGTDLGMLTGADAATALRAVIDGSDSRAARDAMVPLTFLAEVDVAPVLLPVIRSAARPREVRKQAIFWLSQAAQERIAPVLDSVATNDPDLEIRKQAVFALSQRPADESVPALIRIADSKAAAEVRRQAIFWLGQKDDPRVAQWLEARLARP